MIALLLFGCIKTTPPAAWPGSTGRACDDHTLVRIEPEAWSPVEVVWADGTVASERVVATASLRGTTLSLPDATRRCALTGATAEVLSCGDVTIAVHTRPLCAESATDEVLAIASVPLSTPDPSVVDGLDGVLDGSTPATLSLVVDTERTCTVDAVTFGERERALATGRTPTTCGGRTPGGGATDVQLTHLVNGPIRLPPGAPYWGDAPATEAPLRKDGAKGPELLDAFPYLAPLP